MWRQGLSTKSYSRIYLSCENILHLVKGKSGDSRRQNEKKELRYMTYK